MIRLENLLKMSWRHLWNTCWRCFETVLMMRLENVFKMSWRHLWNTCWRCFENVLKTSWQDFLKMSWRYFCKMFSRRIDKMSGRRLLFVLFCFSIWDFFSRPFTNHRTAGEERGHFLNSSLPLRSASQTLRHQLDDYCKELISAHT